MGSSIDAKARYPQSQPEAHNLMNFFADGGVSNVQVGLVIVKAVGVVGSGLFVIGPGSFLQPRKDNSFLDILGSFFRPQIIVPIF